MELFVAKSSSRVSSLRLLLADAWLDQSVVAAAAVAVKLLASLACLTPGLPRRLD